MKVSGLYLRNCLITRSRNRLKLGWERAVLGGVQGALMNHGELFRMQSRVKTNSISFASALSLSLSGYRLWFCILIEHLSQASSVCRPRPSARPLITSTFPGAFLSCDLGWQRTNSRLCSELTLPLQTLLVTFCYVCVCV